MKLTLLATVFITFISSFCNAQWGIPLSREKEFHKRNIAKTHYIFEGTVIKQEYFHNKQKGLLTCNIIQISKIYKGSPQINLGTIKVISQQSGPGVTIEDGGEELNLGNTYIVFGELADSTILCSTSTPIDNNITISRMTSDQPIAITGKNSAWWFPQKFTLDSIYSFFTENGLIQQQADSVKH